MCLEASKTAALPLAIHVLLIYLGWVVVVDVARPGHAFSILEAL